MVEALPKTEPIVDIIGAIAESLNKAQFSIPFTAETAYATNWQRESEELRVVVMPTAETSELAARDDTTIDTYRIQIGVQQECRPDDKPLVGRLMGLVREIKDHLKVTIVVDGLSWIGYEHEPIYDQEHLIEHHQFRTAPAFLYRGGRRI